MTNENTVEEIILREAINATNSPTIYSGNNIHLHSDQFKIFSDKLQLKLEPYYRKKFAGEVMDKIENLKYFATRVPELPYTLVVELEDIKKVLGVDNG